jgi:nitrogenase-associated protein
MPSIEMSHIIFYEKPGCCGNAQQQNWLRAAGHTLDVRNLLTTPWSRDSLLEFLAPLPVAQWFNLAAPAVKQGRVVPEALDAQTALSLLLADPLLIRRPLMRDERGRCMVGFDSAQVQAWIGLDLPHRPPAATEGCIGTPDRCRTPSPNPIE